MLSVHLFLWSPLITFEPTGRFHETPEGSHATEGDLGATILIP
jgi:hypothetical protein